MFFKSIITASMLLISTAAFAQDAMDHSGHVAGMDMSPSSVAFAEANAKMHTDMAIEYSGNTDVDFVRGMIPHHQGAIDMAKVQLQYGKDPEIRKLAEEIIKAQEAEIALMTAWLAANGK
ncbi:MAG: CopM family metallochaperone [Allorhizobium sp.]